MNIVNEYLENRRQDYLFSLAFTALFLFLPYAGYVISYSKESYFLLYCSIFYCAGLLLFLIIKPAYKIHKTKANRYEMYFFKIAPFGIGLLCRYWPPYQRMARRLVNDEAIQCCENALEEMSDDFRCGWEQFCECFLKIEVSDETRKKRYELVRNAINVNIKLKKINLENGFRITAEGIKSRLLLQHEDVAEFLKKEEFDKATCTHFDISEEIFEKKFRSSISHFLDLQKELTEENSTEIFHKLKAYI